MDEPSSDDFKTEISPTEFVDTESVFRLEGEGCVKNEIVQDGEQIWKKDLNSLLELTNHEGKIKTEVEEYDEKPHYDQLENVIVDTFDGSAAGPSGCDKNDIAAHCSVKQECDYEMTEELEIKNDSDIEGMISEDSSQSCSDDTEGEASLQSEGMLNSVNEMERPPTSKHQVINFSKTTERSLEGHIELQHSEEVTGIKQNDLECNFCDFSARDETNLQIHMKRVHSEKKYKCDECEYSAVTSKSVNKHKKTKHSDETTAELKCEFCGYTTRNRWCLKTHTDAIHLKLKNYQCHLCDYRTIRKEILTSHIDSIHFGKKPYQCDECDYSTAWGSSLRIHKKHQHSTHRIELPKKEHKCDSCEYASRNKAHLRIHIECVHLKLKKYKCSSCNYSAKKQEFLQAHIDGIHFGKKKYKCEECDYSTAWTSNFKKHWKKMHVALTAPETASSAPYERSFGAVNVQSSLQE